MPTGIYQHHPHSEKTKKKIGIANSIALKGRVPACVFNVSDETRAKISKTLLMQYRTGERIPPRKGKKWSNDIIEKFRRAKLGKKIGPQSKEHKDKIAKAQSGEKAYNWKGGISEGYLKHLSERKWDIIRKQVYERDSWLCQKCGKHCQAKEIQCHHIIPAILGGTDAKSNLETLDNSCHMKADYQFQFIL